MSEKEQLTVGELIEQLRQFDPNLPVYSSGECGPEFVCGLVQAPIVWVTAGKAGDGVVLGGPDVGTSDDWQRYAIEQLRQHEKFKSRYGETA